MPYFITWTNTERILDAMRYHGESWPGAVDCLPDAVLGNDEFDAILADVRRIDYDLRRLIELRPDLRDRYLAQWEQSNLELRYKIRDAGEADP